MIIKYIWIKDYKNIHDFGINFNHYGSERFKYVDNHLFIKKTSKKQPKDFYSKNIDGITCLVGKNGSGKTNIVEFVNYNLAHVVNSLISGNADVGSGILIFDNYIFKHDSIVIKNHDEVTKRGFHIIAYKKHPLDNGSYSLKQHQMEKNKYIYYSPIMGMRSINLDTSSTNLINISTSYLIDRDYGKTIGYSPLQTYFSNEKLREADFLLTFEKINKFIQNVPVEFRIKLDKEVDNSILQSRVENKTINDELADLVNSSFVEINENKFFRHNDSTKVSGYVCVSIEVQKKIFFRLLIYNIVKALANMSPGILKSGDIKNIFNGNHKSILNNKLDSLMREIEYLIENISWKEEVLFTSAYKYVKEFQTLYGVDNDVYNGLSEQIINIDNPKIKTSVLRITEHTKELLEGHLVFHYQFDHQLSSGEQNLINFYSRFYWAKNEINKKEKTKYGVKGEQIVLFIDEGETTFHPEWQRKFLSLAIKFLTELFKDYRIQIFITTHSPFVLSDIPAESVIFLNTDQDGNSIISKTNQKTFGANIYSLFADSFFMDTTIGEFAKGKIYKAIRTLGKPYKDITSAELNEIKYIIKNIGEPIIKSRLESLLRDKSSKDEIELLKSKIIELESKINNSGEK